ncbi:MAG: hypothetical protein NZ846_01035 [Thermus sp.]|uniref:hypothetical protein n=1 Tax=Thermus sp. TaxID=275 RepID=UPI0025E9FA6F|nr:hypothetical protein [Thermus sp.]MCS7217556.1 hypothetical protein [Thermus sp.]MCX7850532.1 hypothetical protein [Thermus sp.]MDW8018075.1 hypothetical protein [Thermus sp.]
MRPWLASLALLLAPALAQATWIVQTLIPETIALRTPTTEIAFDLKDYPPKSFPAIYPASNLEGGVLPVQVFSNAPGVWSLLLQIPDLKDPGGALLLPARQVLYRVNGGLWLRADGTPQIVYTQAGPTAGWLEIRLEFALELLGNERAGSYVVQALVTALRQP